MIELTQNERFVMTLPAFLAAFGKIGLGSGRRI